MNSKGDQQLTVDATAGGVSLTVPDGANRCYIEVETAAIYYTYDAAAPSSSNGGRANPGDTIRIMGDGRDPMRSIMANLRMLRQTGTSGLANIHYFE